MSKKYLYLLGAAAVVYYLTRPKAAPVRPMKPAVATQALPTDSMMPGVMPAATRGMITDFPRQAQVAALTGMF